MPITSPHSASVQPPVPDPSGETHVHASLPEDTVRAVTYRPAQPGPVVPRMPRVGLPEKLYLKAAKEATDRGDDLTHEAAKVGQYLTLALADPDADWPHVVKMFRHALKRHCRPPEHADEVTRAWFKKLADHVRKHAGREALRRAAEQDECYETRLNLGQTEDEIAEDAEEFFNDICPHCETCPGLYLEDDWRQLKIFRDRWA
jgi:hypothetical protein